MIDLSKHSGYFHDGDVDKIDHTTDHIRFHLRSAEVSEEDNFDSLPLDPDRRITGILEIRNPTQVLVDDVPVQDRLSMKHDDAEILQLNWQAPKVTILLQWIDYPPKPHCNDVETIAVLGGEAYWITSDGTIVKIPL